MIDLNSITRRFLLGEGTVSPNAPTIQSYIQSLGEVLNNFKPRTKNGIRRLTIAKSQLKEIKRITRKLEERVFVLEEQLQILEEDKK